MPTTTKSSKASSKSCPTETSPDYGEDYYRSGNYHDYAERAPRYERMAREVVDFLKSVKLVWRDTTLMDFGCGTGMFAEALLKMGYETYGFDLSTWATAEAAKRGVEPRVGPAHGLFAFDVFEHVTDEVVATSFYIYHPRFAMVRIPVALETGQSFHLAISRADKTHINCKTAAEWEKLFRRLRYLSLRLNLFTLYDSPGVYCALLLKL